MGHRPSAARLHLRSDSTPQARADWRGTRNARRRTKRNLRAGSRLPALFGAVGPRHRLRRRDDPALHDEGGEPASAIVLSFIIRETGARRADAAEKRLVVAGQA